jgi:hypothetical protein
MQFCPDDLPIRNGNYTLRKIFPNKIPFSKKYCILQLVGRKGILLPQVGTSKNKSDFAIFHPLSTTLSQLVRVIPLVKLSNPVVKSVYIEPAQCTSSQLAVHISRFFPNQIISRRKRSVTNVPSRKYLFTDFFHLLRVS